MAGKKYYGYYLNENTYGVVDSWPMCQEICKGQKGARYKGFTSRQEAEEWIGKGGEYAEKTGKFYAYYLEGLGTSGIVNSWSECQEKTKKYKARYKSFKSKKEAEKWIADGAKYEDKNEVKANLPEGIYFDAGTGRGIGVEVRVTDVKGKSILDKLLEKNKINQFGNYLCKEGATNNFGELLGIYIALKIAIKEDEKAIFGDSALVINYWSKGYIKKENVNEETLELSKKVKSLREIFEEKGGKVSHVSGDYNPADLGFHR